MNYNQHKKIVGFITILSGIIAFLSYFLVAAAVNFNFDFFSNPVIIFSLENVNISMLRLSMITDVFGYYLLLLPALYFIYDWLKDKTPWKNLLTFCGTSYILIGAVGASILAFIWPYHLNEFTSASTQQQETIKLLFGSFSQMVAGGMWNMFDSLVGGIWWIGAGVFIKKEYRILGWFTILVGLLSLLDSFGNILEISVLAETAVNLYLIFAPLWAIFLGFKLLNKNSFNMEVN